MLSTACPFFVGIKRILQAARVKAAMRREESTQMRTLADVVAIVDKTSTAKAALDDHAIKALTGES